MDTSDAMIFFQWFVLTTGSTSTLITEDHESAGFTAVPENLNTNVEHLILSNNKLQNITVTSLANYPTLINLDVARNEIRYIHDGSFDHNPTLEYLNLNSNFLRYIPTYFSLAQNSLIHIRLWDGLEKELETMNFSKFLLLKTLNLGSNPLAKFDASNLPKDLDNFLLAYALLLEMPNFSIYTPEITVIKLRNNNLSYIPADSMLELQQLREFDIRANRLETIPDLYDRPLEKLRINDNPLNCNESLCWVRLWARTKGVALKSIDSAVCQSPSYFAGQMLVEVDPVQMACYKGECDSG